MTTLSLAKHSARFHKFIRDEEISHIFQHSRILLKEYTVPQATARLQQIAVSIRVNLISRDRRALGLDLTAIHSIAGQYYIIDYLLSQLSFPEGQSEGVHDELPLNCTLVDIFLIFITGDDQIVRQECAALLQLSIEQIVRAKREGRKEVLYISQVERILQQFPFDLLSRSQQKYSVYLLNSLQEIVLLQEYWYKDQQFCNQLNGAFEFVQALINNGNSNKEQVTESAINSALIFIYYIQKQGLKSQFQLCQGLRDYLKISLLTKIANSDYCEVDFKRLKVLILSKVKFTLEQFQILQGIIDIQIEKKSYFFFEALNILTHYSHFPLQLQSIKHLLHFVMNEHSVIEEQRLTQMIASLNFKNALLYKQKHPSNYHSYLQLMIQYFDIDTITPLLQAANQSNPTLTQQILSTLQLILEDAASLDAQTALEWSRMIESEGRL